jgi:hypothetical protein
LERPLVALAEAVREFEDWEAAGRPDLIEFRFSQIEKDFAERKKRDRALVRKYAG